MIKNFRYLLFLFLLVISFNTTAQDILGGTANEGTLKIEIDNSTGYGSATELQTYRYTNGAWVKQWFGDGNRSFKLYSTSDGGHANGYFYTSGSNWDNISYNAIDANNHESTVSMTDGLEVKRTIYYPNNSSTIRYKWEITNNASTTKYGLRFFVGGDTWLDGGDYGIGIWDPIEDKIGVYKSDGISGQNVEVWLDSESETSYNHQSNSYSQVEINIEASNPYLDNTVDDSNHDNGIALEWRKFSLAPGSTWTIQALEWYDSKLTSDLEVTAPSNETISPCETKDIVFTVENISGSTVSNITLTELIDLPGWTVDVTDPVGTFNLASGVSQNVTVSVTADCGATVGEIAQCELTANDGSDDANDVAYIEVVTPLCSAGDASSTDPVCLGSGINITHTTLDATGIVNNGIDGENGLPSGTSATWSDNTITISGTPIESGTFNYSISLTGGACTIETATGTIVVNDLPTATANNSGEICSGESFTLNETGGDAISWEWVSLNGSATITNSSDQSPTITGAENGEEFEVTVTDANTCQSTSTSTVTVNEVPSINPIPSYNECNLAYILDENIITGTNLTSGIGFYSLAGGAGVSIPNGTEFSAGTDTVIYVYDENGTCNDQVSFSVIINTCDVTPRCSGDPIINSAIGFNASNSQYYILSDSATGEIISYNLTGEFTSDDYGIDNFETFSLHAVNTSEPTLIQTINSASLWSEIENDASTLCADILGPKYYEIIQCCDLEVTSTTSNEICEGENNGVLNLTISGTSTYSILLDNNSIENSANSGDYPFSELSPNTYEVQLTDNIYANCDTSFNFTISPGLEIDSTSIDTTICFGDTVEINGTIYTANNISGFETLTSTTTGCDSVLSINITVIEIDTVILPINLCFGEDTTLYETTYSASNPTGFETLTSVNTGCDSVLSIIITENEIDTTIVAVNLCFGEDTLINETYYSANNPSGFETLTSTITGCDSVLYIIVTEKPEIKTPINDTVCFGDSIDINGTGTYYSASNPSGTQILTSLIDGCDSTLIINIFERSQTINDDTVQVCDGGSFIYNGVTYDVDNPSGADTTIDNHGCISYIRIIELIEVNEIVNNLNISLCYGQDSIINGVIYNSENTAGSFSEVSSGGCDSIINITITPLDQVTGVLNDTVCFGDSIEIYGSYYSAENPGGFYTFIEGASNGCDSVLEINVFQLDQIIVDLRDTLCFGDSIELFGTYYSAENQTGTDTIITTNYCDTIVNINIFVREEITSVINDTLCFGDSIIVNGTVYNNENSNGTEIFTSENSCDSIVSISLFIIDLIDTTVFYSICEGDSIVINGNTYDANNLTGSDTIQSIIHGCDSIVNHQFEINETPITLITDTICFGDSIVINGTIYDAGNLSGSDTIQSVIHGCDSIVRVSIYQSPENINIIDSTICFNDYININGTIYNSSNPNGIDTLIAANGCDSIIQITISELEDINISINDTLCYGESIVINNVTYNADNNSGIEVLTSSYGCDSTINISINEQTQIRSFINETICQNDTVYYFNNAYYYGNQFGQMILPAINGCDSTINISVNVQELPNIYAQLVVNFDTTYNLLDGDADSICDFDTIQLFGNGGEVYQWANNIIDGGEILYPFDEFYSLIGTDSNGCSNSFEFDLFTDEYCIKFNLDTSNVFTPDGDGINDVFLMSGESFETNSIQIYNRWGQIIYENFDGKGWDGRLQSGEEAEPGTYFYMTTIKPITRQPSDVLSVQGYLKLIR